MKRQYNNPSLRKTPWDEKESLSPSESFIKSNYLDTYFSKHIQLSQTNEASFINSFQPACCPQCGSTLFKKNGFDVNDIQRYKCTACHKGFSVLTNTIFEDHKISIVEWIEYCLQLISYESMHAIGNNNRNSQTTSRYWLQKVFLVLKDYQNDIILSGRVVIDETYYSVMRKYRIKKDGKELHGISNNKFCIAVGCDDKGRSIFILEGMGKPSTIKTRNAYESHIAAGSHLVHDKERSHSVLVKELNLTEEVYSSKELSEKEDKDNPLQQVNHLHFLLKDFLNAHSGFDRDDLQDYLNLFALIMNPPEERLEKVRILLNSAMHSAVSLRYRDFYAKKADK